MHDLNTAAAAIRSVALVGTVAVVDFLFVLPEALVLVAADLVAACIQLAVCLHPFGVQPLPLAAFPLQCAAAALGTLRKLWLPARGRLGGV